MEHQSRQKNTWQNCDSAEKRQLLYVLVADHEQEYAQIPDGADKH